MDCYQRLCARISELCARYRRPLPRLLAVTKGRNVAEIRQLYAAGQREFAENYWDELNNKAQQLSDLEELRWIFIGTLQSNKIKRLVTVCAEIQTIASLKHAQHLERQLVASAKTSSYPIYLSVNIGAEHQKSGLEPTKVLELTKQLETSCPHLKLEGLMAIPPQEYNDQRWSEIPPLYQKLARLAQSCGAGKLSLGMSADLQLAIMAGSTCLRIGRDLFSPTNF